MKPVRGFAIVSAIFILVVLAALGAFIVNISTSQQIGSALDVQGVRAYQAARAGIEWGMYRVLQDANFGANTPDQNTNQLSLSSGCQSTLPGSPTTTPITLTATTLSSFSVTVSCFATHDGTNKGPWVYSIQSTACSQSPCPNTSPGNLYVERRLTVTF
jgi:MSHA biogenesis protein MshP